jgi:4-hydroxybenzoate polyprenyltransferase
VSTDRVGMGLGRWTPQRVRLEPELVSVNLDHEAISAFVLSRPLAAARLLLTERSLDALYDAAAAHGPERDQFTELGPRTVAATAGAGRPARRDLIRLLRPHQWLKNLLVLVALFTAQKVEHPLLTLRALAMFVAFCLVSSSVYVLNDLADLAADRTHATKRNRPLASGAVGVIHAWALWPVLLSAGAALAIVTLPLTACLWLLAYYAGTVAYTFGAKREAVLDVIVLAGLYTVRIIAGAAAIGVPTSIWLLMFSMSIFTSLALVKRVSELTRVIECGGVLRGRGYEPRDLATLKSLGVTASYAAVVVLALYVHDPITAHLYETPSILWLVVPLMLYWSSRLWLLADRGEIDEDPLLFATRDRASYVILLATALAFTAAKFIG